MPNDVLVDRVLALANDVTASERLILKLAAALIKQLDEDTYEIREDNDPRIKLSGNEFEWLPDRFEIWNGIPCPKDWATPERMAAVAKEKRELAELEEQYQGDRNAAMREYLKRRDASRRK